MNLIRLAQGTTTLVLQGSGMAAPVKGAVLWKEPSSPTLSPAGRGEQETVEDVRVQLEGSVSTMEATLATLARWLVEAERKAELSGESWVYLEVQVTSGGTTWRSKVLGGELATLAVGPDQRAVLSQGVKLLLRRVDYWEDSTESELYINSAATARATGGVTIYNDWATDKNYVQLLAADASGDLPAPAKVIFTNSSGVNASVYAGQNVNLDPGNLVPILQGEDGSAGASSTVTDTSAASASGAYFARIEWTGSDAVVGIAFAISSTLAGYLVNWPFLPIARIHNNIASGEEFWAYWRIVSTVGANTDVLVEGRPGYLSNTAYLQPGSPLYLPLWESESGDGTPALTLELVLQADDTGDHDLDLDYVFLMPLEYWRNYKMTANYLAGMYLQDDPYRDMVKSYATLMGHQAEGPGLWVLPNQLQRYYFLIEGASSMLPSQSSTVKMYYHPRKKSL